MLYLNISSRKSLRLLGLLALLVAALGLTFLGIRKLRLPPDYFSADNLMIVSSLPLTASVYSLDYQRQSSNPAAAVASAQPAAQDLPVLLYHGITKETDRFSLTPDLFKEQLFALKQAGYQTVTLADFAAWQRGEKELSDKSFLLTFDDGRRDSYLGADPILKALDYTAVMFVATHPSVEQPPDTVSSYYLHEPDLRSMLRSGRWELESHAVQPTGGFVPVAADGGRGNFLSNRAWLPEAGRLETESEYEIRIAAELSRSKSELEQTFERPVTAFAFPFGDYGDQSLDPAGPAGAIKTVAKLVRQFYPLAFIQVWPKTDQFSSNYRGGNPTYLRRVEVGTDWSGGQLVAALERAHGKTLPYVDSLITDQGWKNNWGEVKINEGLRLAATAGSTGALTFLDGTGAWRDYRLTAKAEVAPGSHLSLIARLADGQNYLSCAFGNGRVQIIRKKDGVQESLVNVPSLVNSPASLGIAVKGGDLRCYQDDLVVAYDHYGAASLPQGGIGFQVWDPALGQAKALITSLNIEAL